MRGPRRFSLGLSLALFAAGACGDDPSTGSDEDRCASVVEYEIGTSARDSLTVRDCLLSDGTLIDFYRFTVGDQHSLQLTLESVELDAFLWLFAEDTAGSPVTAVGDDVNASTNAVIRIVLAGGTYLLGANSPPPTQTGDYRLSSQTVLESVTGCVDAWVTAGITTSQTISESDCTRPDPAYFDKFLIIVQARQSVTVTQSSADFDPRLLVLGSTGDTVGVSDGTAGGALAQVTLAPGATNLFVIETGTAAASAVGAYTLDVQ